MGSYLLAQRTHSVDSDWAIRRRRGVQVMEQIQIRTALKSMRNQRIPFIGPLRTASGLIVVATGKVVLTGNALIDRNRALVGTLNGHIAKN